MCDYECSYVRCFIVLCLSLFMQRFLCIQSPGQLSEHPSPWQLEWPGSSTEGKTPRSYYCLFSLPVSLSLPVSFCLSLPLPLTLLTLADDECEIIVCRVHGLNWGGGLLWQLCPHFNLPYSPATLPLTLSLSLGGGS